MSGVVRPVTRVARGATYLFFQGMASSITGLVYFFFLVRLLPPPPENPEMGVFAVLTFIQTLMQVFGTLALGMASTKYIAQYMAEGNVKKARSVVARVLQFSLLTSAASFVVLFASSSWLSLVLLGTPKWAPLFRILAFTSFFMFLRPHVGRFLQGLQRIRELAIINMTYDVVHKSLAIYLLYAGIGLYSVVYGWFVGFMVASFVGLALTARLIGIFEKPHSVRPLIKFSFPIYISNILTFFVGWVDQLFILPFMGAAYLGFYNVAVQAAIVPQLISTSIVTAMFPQLSELQARQGKDSLRRAFHISTRVVLVSFPVILGLAALAYPLIVLIRADYVDAVAPLIIICFASLPRALGVATRPTLLTLERTKTVLKISTASILIKTLVAYTTLAYFNLGITGPAWARVFSSLVAIGLGMYALRKTLRITIDKEALWKSVLSSSLMVIVVMSVERLVFHAYLLPLYTIIGISVYLLFLITLKAIKKSDVERVRDYLPSRLKWAASWLDRVAVAG